MIEYERTTESKTLQIPDLDHIATHGLYNPANEHDSCGVGVVANIDGSRDHLIISMALRVMIVSDEMIESGRGAVTVEEIVNFGLAAGASYIAFLRASRAAFTDACDHKRF